MGWFSSDRTIREYARDIWRARVMNGDEGRDAARQAGGSATPKSTRSSPARTTTRSRVLGPASRPATAGSPAPSSPAPRRVDAPRRSTARPLGELDAARRGGLLRRQGRARRARRRSATRAANAGGDVERRSTPTRFGPVLGPMDDYYSARARISASSTSSARMRSSTKASTACTSPSGRRMRGASPSSATSTPGTAAATRCASASTPASGRSSCPDSARARSTSTRSSAPTATLLPLKADPVRLRRRAAAVDRLGRRATPTHVRVDRRRLDGGARRPRSAPRADVDLRGASRLVAARATATASSPTTSSPTQLIPYAVDMGFTHIELLPITEHPLDASWGYQPTGLFAPTARFGEPAGFARFVDRAIAPGSACILDWVPAHFPTDPHGLARFDGTALYEHADPRQGFHPDWNTAIFNFGRQRGRQLPDRQRALLARALPRRRPARRCGRLDALPRLLAQGRRVAAQPARRQREPRGGRLPAQAERGGLRRAIPASSRSPRNRPPGPAVSQPTYAGGLGFGFKWNMGLMHDTLRVHVARAGAPPASTTTR